MNTAIKVSRYTAMKADELRDGIRAENTKARSLARKSLEHVRACGDMLSELKGKIPHGLWLYELKSLGIERRTASNYIRIAEKWETVSHLNGRVKDALKLLSKAEDPPPALTPAPARTRTSPPIIDAEIIEAEQSPKPQHGSIKESCWEIARQFIGKLKDHSAWEERSAICDVMQICKDRIAELDKLNGREKP